jgi:hypothetical protein
MFRKVCNFLMYTLDTKSKPQSFFYNNQTKLVTREGVCLSIIFYFITAVIFLNYFVRDLFVRDKPFVLQTSHMNNLLEKTQLQTDNFKLKFSILNLYGPDIPQDSFSFFITQVTFDGSTVKNSDVTYSKCEPIVGGYTAYCIDPRQVLTLSGGLHSSSFDVFGIDIHFKKDYAAKFNSNQLMFVMTFTDQLVDLADVYDPVKEAKYLYSVFVSPNYSQFIYANLKRVDLQLGGRLFSDVTQTSLLTLNDIDNHYFFSDDQHDYRTLTTVYFSLMKNKDVYQTTFVNSGNVLGQLGGFIFLINALCNFASEYLGRRQILNYVHGNYKISDADLNASSHELVRIEGSFVHNIQPQRIEINNALNAKLGSGPQEFIHDNINVNPGGAGGRGEIIIPEDDLAIPSNIEYHDYVTQVMKILDPAQIVDMYIHLLIVKEVLFTDAENIYMNNLSNQTFGYLLNKDIWRKSRVGGNFPNIKSLIATAKRRYR